MSKTAFKGDSAMTDLIFSFDTEDYINYDVADDIIKVAQLLRKNGIPSA